MLSSVVSKSLTRPGSTCGPTWTAAPGPVVGRSNARQALDVAARLDVRTDLDGGSRPGGRALERSPGARRGSAARRADRPGPRLPAWQ